MKHPYCLLSLLFITVSACEKKSENASTQKTPVVNSPADDERSKQDTPILPLKKGDWWKYKTHVEVPAGVTSEGGSALDTLQEKTRTYIGKVKPSENLPEVDAFDVKSTGQPMERELIEIYDNRIMMRGTAKPDEPDSKPVWLDPAVPFVIAGMRGGQQVLDFEVQKGARHRGLKVVGRENVKVPAGEFVAIRLLMTGNDGPIEIHRTTWFAPRVGIIKEERARYSGDKLLMRETVELTETSIEAK